MNRKDHRSLATIAGWLFILAWMGICGFVVLLVNGRTLDDVAPLGFFGVLMLGGALLVRWRDERAIEQRITRMFPDLVTAWEFGQRVLQGRAGDCRINVSEFKKLYNDRLCSGFAQAGVSFGKYSQMLSNSLSSYCPKCELRLGGGELGFLVTTRDFGMFRKGVAINWSAVNASRFAQGECPNCAAKEMILSWRPAQAEEGQHQDEVAG